MDNCRGQCYDRASNNMSGARSGVSTQVTNIEPKTLYIHCYEHALSLAEKD